MFLLLRNQKNVQRENDLDVTRERQPAPTADGNATTKGLEENYMAVHAQCYRAGAIQAHAHYVSEECLGRKSTN